MKKILTNMKNPKKKKHLLHIKYDNVCLFKALIKVGYYRRHIIKIISIRYYSNCINLLHLNN